MRRFRLTYIAIAASVALLVASALGSMADTCNAGMVYGLFAASIATAIAGIALSVVALVRGPRGALTWGLAVGAWAVALVMLSLQAGASVAITLSCAAVR